MSRSRGFCENEPHFVFSPILHTDVSPQNVAKKCWNMGENTKCGSFWQKPLERLIYTIYIER